MAQDREDWTTVTWTLAFKLNALAHLAAIQRALQEFDQLLAGSYSQFTHAGNLHKNKREQIDRFVEETEGLLKAVHTRESMKQASHLAGNKATPASRRFFQAVQKDIPPGHEFARALKMLTESLHGQTY